MSQANETTLEYTLICTEKDVPGDGGILTRNVNGKSVALSRGRRDAQTIVAFGTTCPHMRAPFRYGRVVDGEVVCPWHFFRFDTETGKTIGCESTMKLEIFPVKVIGGDVYVHLEK